MLMSQHNAWIHAAATFVVVAFGLVAGLSRPEWCWIAVAIAAVWTAEALNTAIEFLTDIVAPTHHPAAEKAKDVAAGGVLIAAAGAVVIGILVFWPHLLDLVAP